MNDVYIIFKNNEEEYEDYDEWIYKIYANQSKAEKRFIELIKTNKYKEDRKIRKAKYNENVGAYRLEKYQVILEE